MKQEIIDNLIKDKICSAEFKKYEKYYNYELDCYTMDYDICLTDKNGNVKYGGFIKWTKYDILCIEIECEEEIYSILNGVYGGTVINIMIERYIRDIFVERLKTDEQFKHEPKPRNTKWHRR